MLDQEVTTMRNTKQYCSPGVSMGELVTSVVFIGCLTGAWLRYLNTGVAAS